MLGMLRSLSRPHASLSLRISSRSYQNHKEYSNHQQNFTNNYSRWWVTAGVSTALVVGSGYNMDIFRTAYMESADFDFNPPERKELPTYKVEEVAKHGKNADTIWVTYKGGVYDVTNFLQSHPGGDKILLAAGSTVEPFWALYAQHKTEEVAEILETLRIGNLDPNSIPKTEETNASDPYNEDPKRHPALIVNSKKPFNAETPPSLLVDHFETPNDLFFVRNHMPVPKIDLQRHRLVVEGKGIKKPIILSVEDLKKNYKQCSVSSVVQCAGNRREDMNKYKKVAGLMWGATAISNAKWTGVCLRDLLVEAGVDPSDDTIKHVHLEGADTDITGQSYGASIPFEKAMSSEVIIAYQMNGEDIPPDHGFPLRLIVPGHVGARQVKWLRTIRLSDVESPSHWQQKDYRSFSLAVEMDDVLEWDKVPSIQEYPIQSAFCVPAPGTSVDRDDGEIDVAGYAWSGGGRGIIRVEVSVDGGMTWQSAELTRDPEQDLEHTWAWTLFRASLKIPDHLKKLDLVVKATDRAYNTQPETPSGIWNVRGLLNNSWHRVSVDINE